MAFKSVSLWCIFLTFALVKVIKSDDLYVGSTDNATLSYSILLDMPPISWMRRVKNVYYGGNSIIQGIVCIDKNNSSGKAIVSNGGVGKRYVAIKLQSERGNGLKYDVKIYTDQE